MVAASNLRCGRAVRPSEIAGLNSRSPRIGPSPERTVRQPSAMVHSVRAGHPAAYSRQINKRNHKTEST
jgi:hypothetical protein